MNKKFIFIIGLIIFFPTFINSQNLTIDETLKYISDNSSTYLKVDSEGFIYNNRYKFHASDVSATEHMSSAVRIMCPSTIIPGAYGDFITSPPKCIKCLNKDCYDGTYGGQSSTADMYINIESSYDQQRLIKAINYLIKKVKEKYPKKGSSDPFAR